MTLGIQFIAGFLIVSLNLIKSEFVSAWHTTNCSGLAGWQCRSWCGEKSL